MTKLVKRKKPKSTFRETRSNLELPTRPEPPPALELTKAEIRRRIDDCIVGVISDHCSKMHADYLGKYDAESNLDKDHIEALTEGLRKAKLSKLSKRIKSALVDATKDFESEFERYLKMRGPQYPKKWMTKDRKIRATFRRYPLLVPLLNFIDQRNRYIRGDQLKEMEQIGNGVCEGPKYKRKYQYADIVVDRHFYAEFCKYTKIDTKTRQLQKYITVLVDKGILVKRGKIHRGGFVYADGYYYKSAAVGTIKRTFLKGTLIFKKALRTFELPR